MKLRRLTLPLGLGGLFTSLHSVDPMHLLFAFVTHLDIHDRLPEDHGEMRRFIAKLTLLPALTHLALSRPKDSVAIAELLSTKTNLQVLVGIQFSRLHPLTDLPLVDDARFVSIRVVGFEDLGNDWLAGVNGRLDFWARAELFVAKKRRGEIEPGLSFLLPTIYYV
jgi:hypothetical protein